MPISTDLSPGHFARLLLVALIIVIIALLAWQIVDVMLLVFGAILLAVMLRRSPTGWPNGRRFPQAGLWPPWCWGSWWCLGFADGCSALRFRGRSINWSKWCPRPGEQSRGSFRGIRGDGAFWRRSSSSIPPAFPAGSCGKPVRC